MKKILEKLADLITVKTIVTVAVIFVFVVLALRGDIRADNAMIIISMVVSFYFGTQHQKNTGKVTSGSGIPQGETVVIENTDQRSMPAPVDTSMYNNMHPTEEK